MNEISIPCPDLNEALDFFTARLGFRVDMVIPADAPVAAVVSGHGVRIRLERSDEAAWTALQSYSAVQLTHPIISRCEGANWITGRAGMEYRDLIPGRLGGRLVASLIRLNAGGEVADYVHYHKIRFQMIYCWHGRVRVVYENQGEFWLHPGDCVLQPPEIRHRVLESSAGAQVIEVTSPAIHETWADHEMQLPTGSDNPERDFNGQRFILHTAAQSTPVFGEFGGFESHHMGIFEASGGAARVFELRSQNDHSNAVIASEPAAFTFYFVLSGRLTASSSHFGEQKFNAGDSILIPPKTEHQLDAPANSEILRVVI